jgi:hypothetical protein
LFSLGSIDTSNTSYPSSGGGWNSVYSSSASFIGKIWNLPNTAIGVTWGVLGGGFIPGVGAEVSFENNAIQFINHPFMDGAITIGNTISYMEGFGPEYKLPNGPVRLHEIQHTYQGQVLGPLYLPANIIGGISGLITGGDWHAPANFMEVGPQSTPPSPFAKRKGDANE